MDFSTSFGATFREVGEGLRDGKPTRIVRASRTYATGQPDLWDALTNVDRVHRWFGEVSGDLKPGGHYSIKDNAAGTITVCEPPKTLALTWEFSGNLSWVGVDVQDTQDGALLTLEHEMPKDPESEAQWTRYGPGATGVGWELALIGLDMHFASDGQSSLDEGIAWAEGERGKATLRSWAEAWGQAHVVAGELAETAHNMADRTARFYAGEQ